MSAVHLVSPLTYSAWNINVTVPVANSITEVPFQAYIVDSDTNEIICGASILSSLVILTAASCLARRNGSELTVVAGDSRFYKGDESEQRIPVSFIHIYEDFNSSGMDFDYNLAAAFLSSNLTFNRYVTSIDIPFKRWTYEGNVTVSGYAKTNGSEIYDDNLQVDSIPIISGAESTKKWNMDELISDKYICVYKNETSASTDLPGGLLTGNVDGVPMLLGVATRSLDEGPELSNEKPRIYTNVAQFRPWIHRMLHHPAILILNECNEGETRSTDSSECFPNEFLFEEDNDCGSNCSGKMNFSSLLCNSHGRFWCPSSNKCIPSKFICDGHYSCDNGEDEINCSSTNCTETKRFWCSRSSKCIPNQFVCDGDDDCRDNEDEMNCSPSNCTANGRFWCSNSSKCIPTRHVCNSYDNCGNNEDEMNCETSGTCSEEEFNCRHSSKCIRSNLVCNGEDDCGNNSDEVNCPFTNRCRGSDFWCPNSNKCLPSYKICNGEDDCGNNSDELNCNEMSCNILKKFWCPSSSKCIDHSLVCDGDNECANGEDESKCAKITLKCEGQFRCPNSSKCIFSEHVCDGFNNCGNGGDEVNCTNDANCNGSKKFWCLSSFKCIHERLVCNGADDCANGEDEIDCTNKTLCSEEQFRCPDSSKCIPIRFVCDGDNDCVNNADEIYCSVLKCNESALFWCPSSANCISHSLVCNGVSDCANGEDELNCTKHNSNCSEKEFECTRSHKCISSNFVCDGEDDCGNNDDEAHCNQTILEHFLSYGRKFNYPPYSSIPSRKVDQWSSNGVLNIQLLINFLDRLREYHKGLNETFLQYQSLLVSMKKVLINCDKRRGTTLIDLMESLLWKHRMLDEVAKREHENFIQQLGLEAFKENSDTQLFLTVAEGERKVFKISVERFQLYHRLLLSLKEGINTCNQQRASMLIEMMETFLQQHRMDIEREKRDNDSIVRFMRQQLGRHIRYVEFSETPVYSEEDIE